MATKSEFDDIINFLHQHLQESQKPDFKRNEIRKPDLTELNKDENAINGIILQLVSKMYLLYDVVEQTDVLETKCFIKRIKHNECSIFKQFFPCKEHKIISNVIDNLSDTKYALVLSALSYDILNTVIQPETLTKAFWNRSKSPVIIITNKVFQVRNNQPNVAGDFHFPNSSKDQSDFEAKLLQLLSGVSNANESTPVAYDYSFWVLKVEKLMFAVLLPRYDLKKNFLINVWPILPVSSFFSVKKMISNFKVAKSDKDLFSSVAATIRSTNPISLINLKKELLNGITLPLLIQNKVYLNTIYMAFFFEFIQENENFQYSSQNSQLAEYFKCRHCSFTFNNIFDFTRHIWTFKQKHIFKCHLCNERTINLNKLASHYRQKHYHAISSYKFRMTNTKTYQRNSKEIPSNSSFTKDNNRLLLPELRQCIYCGFTKEDLNSMRNHLKAEHVTNMMISIVKSVRSTGLKIFEALDPFFANLRNPVYMNMIDLDSSFNRRYFTWDQFVILFKHHVQCPFCVHTPTKNVELKNAKNNKINETVFDDWLKYLTHMARVHCTFKPYDYKPLHYSDSNESIHNKFDKYPENIEKKILKDSVTKCKKNKKNHVPKKVEKDYLKSSVSLEKERVPVVKTNKATTTKIRRSKFDYDKYDKNKFMPSNDTNRDCETLNTTHSPNSIYNIPSFVDDILEVKDNVKIPQILVEGNQVKTKDVENDTWKTDTIEFF